MNLEILRMAFQSLWSNKVRSWLSILGIIIGVSTVIAVVGIGMGAQKKVEEQFKNLSATTIMVSPTGGRSASSKLSDKDVPFVLENAPSISSGTAVLRGNNIAITGESAEKNVTVLGGYPELFTESNLFFEEGKSFEESDILSRSQKVVLGRNLADELFEEVPLQNVLEKTVTISGRKYEIIGILKLNGQSGMISYDDTLFMPYKTAERNILGSNGTVLLYFNARSIDEVNIALLEIESLLRESHRLRSTQDNDFRVRDPGSIVASAQESSQTMTYLLTAVATIVLIVSGIGIMNVMFVSVSERTKEIGVLKALGAQQKDVLFQFLSEAVILSLLGGIVGILLGYSVIPLLQENFGAVYSFWGGVIGFSFSALVGIFFGFYPAFKASHLDPVEALRSE